MKKMWAKIYKIPAQTWLILFLVSSLICVFALRHNNQHMVNLRNEVYQVDKNNGDVDTALKNLQRYVNAHMNTNLTSGNNNIKPPIQLKYTYERLKAAQINQIQISNQKIYTDAQNYCQSINNAYFGTTRVPCVQNYVTNHGIKSTDNINIPAGLYQFDFVSPSWTPDLAGLSLVATVLFLIAFLLRFGADKLLGQKE